MINPIYTKKDTIEKLRHYYLNQESLNSVTMTRFFTQDFIIRQISKLESIKFEEYVNHIQFRFEKADIEEELKKILISSEFSAIVEKITDSNIGLIKGSTYKFGWKQYKILHDETVKDPAIDIIVDLTPQWNDKFGGTLTYVDGEGQSYEIPSNLGSVTLVNRKLGFQYYVSYVNHYAQESNRYLVIAESNLET